MSLADRAMIPIPVTIAGPGVVLSWACHTATWFYAAEEATALGRLPARTVVARAQNIVGNFNPGSAESAMAGLTKSGNWNFSKGMPPPGSVMFWPALVGVSHSAVSTPGGIAGYNQACICAAPLQNNAHTILLPSALRGDKRTCQLISPITIVTAAVTAAL